MERYKKLFNEEQEKACEACKEQCDCKDCDCDDKMEEKCPHGNASGGMCATVDNSGKLKGVCQNGYIFDKVHDKCIPAVK